MYIPSLYIPISVMFPLGGLLTFRYPPTTITEHSEDVWASVPLGNKIWVIIPLLVTLSDVDGFATNHSQSTGSRLTAQLETLSTNTLCIIHSKLWPCRFKSVVKIPHGKKQTSKFNFSTSCTVQINQYNGIACICESPCYEWIVLWWYMAKPSITHGLLHASRTMAVTDSSYC